MGFQKVRGEKEKGLSAGAKKRILVGKVVK